ITLWISAGALTVVTAGSTSPRIGVLPSVGWLALALVAALVIGLIARPAGRAGAILCLSALLLMPWVPLPVPRAALIGPGLLRMWLWAVLAAALAGPRLAAWVGGWRVVRDPRRAPWLAASVTAALSLVAAWQVFPRLPAGDEPHYLIITQSLLAD